VPEFQVLLSANTRSQNFRFRRLIAIFASTKNCFAMKKFLYLLVLLPALTACHKKNPAEANWSHARMEAETMADSLLRDSRRACLRGDYSRARLLLDSIRVHHALALNVREKGILLLDSINLFDARQQLERMDTLMAQSDVSDSVKALFEENAHKVKFYRRKLAHDRSKQKKH